MSNYTILWMFENPRSGRQARNFTTNAPKILDLKSSSEQIFSRKLPLGAPELSCLISELRILKNHKSTNIQRIDLCLVSFDSFGSLLFRKKKKKIYGAPMKSSELFVLNYTVITVTIEVACVASVSSRGSSRKLGQEQKNFFASALPFAQ